MASSRATSLFHFTKSLDNVETILMDGFFPRLCLEDISWVGGEGGIDFAAIPITCFCDIPIARISDHVDFYGEYGIGLSKEWALKNGLNPIFYISSSSPIAQSFTAAICAAVRSDSENKKVEDRATGHLHFMWAHAKPLSGNMFIGGKNIEKSFYLENEWRYVPKIEGDPIIRLKHYWEDQEKRDEINDKLKKKALQFIPSDLRYIFVKQDADIPRLVKFIKSKLAHKFSKKERDILTTRITSLEHMQQDI